jgi:hypothetical protein
VNFCRLLASKSGSAMPQYRCYFLDSDKAIRDVAFIDCATDELATERACELLMERRFPIVQLWLLDRQLYQAKKA